MCIVMYAIKNSLKNVFGWQHRRYELRRSQIVLRNTPAFGCQRSLNKSLKWFSSEFEFKENQQTEFMGQ